MPGDVIAAVITALPAAPHAVAEDAAPTPAREAVATRTARTRPGDVSLEKPGSFKEFGQELGKTRCFIGNATVETARSGAGRIRRIVKEENLEPGPAPATAPSLQDRGGTR